VTLLEIRENPVTFEDTVGERVNGSRRLVPAGAVRAGRWVAPKATGR
jgi:hypothetical protein